MEKTLRISMDGDLLPLKFQSKPQVYQARWILLRHHLIVLLLRSSGLHHQLATLQLLSTTSLLPIVQEHLLLTQTVMELWHQLFQTRHVNLF